MKKGLPIILAVLFLTLSAIPTSALVTYGIKGGINNSKISFSPGVNFSNQDYLKGFSAGAFLIINLGPVGFQPEILVSRRGLHYNFVPDPSQPAQVAEAKYLLDYLEIPLLVRLNIIPIGPVKTYFFGGPSYGYLLRARRQIVSPANGSPVNVKDDFSRKEFAAVAGLGLDVDIPLLFKLTADVRYHYTLGNILSETSTLSEKARNQGYSIMIGIGF